jgi:hypothetical protein
MMPPPSPTTPTEPPADDSPRLGIIHLLTWTLGVALILAVQKHLGVVRWSANSFQGVAYLGLGLVHAMASGAAVGGVVILAWRLFNGKPFPTQAGHWLLVALGVIAILGALSWVAQEHVIQLAEEAARAESDAGEQGHVERIDGYRRRQLVYMANVTFMGMVSTAAFAVPTLLVRDGQRWTVFFAMLVLLNFMQALLGIAVFAIASLDMASMGVPRPLFLIESILGIVLLAIALSGDRAASRDWLHWTGAVVFFVMSAVPLAGQVFVLVLNAA